MENSSVHSSHYETNSVYFKRRGGKPQWMKCSKSFLDESVDWFKKDANLYAPDMAYRLDVTINSAWNFIKQFCELDKEELNRRKYLHHGKMIWGPVNVESEVCIKALAKEFMQIRESEHLDDEQMAQRVGGCWPTITRIRTGIAKYCPEYKTAAVEYQIVRVTNHHSTGHTRYGDRGGAIQGDLFEQHKNCEIQQASNTLIIKENAKVVQLYQTKQVEKKWYEHNSLYLSIVDKNDLIDLSDGLIEKIRKEINWKHIEERENAHQQALIKVAKNPLAAGTNDYIMCKAPVHRVEFNSNVFRFKVILIDRESDYVVIELIKVSMK